MRQGPSFAELGNPTSALEAALVRAEAMTLAGRPAEALDIVTAAEHEAHADAASPCRACASSAPGPSWPSTGSGRRRRW